MQDYNVTVRSFPTNLTAMLFKMDVKPNFTVDNEKAISVPPTVDFSKPRLLLLLPLRRPRRRTDRLESLAPGAAVSAA